ncbi:MAG: hypothetical protein JWL84_3202 [Rhodospirillales bacterium]|jgi:hypothetical protein|nr:hypothetical protein [Rhodospirillales bacterium]
MPYVTEFSLCAAAFIASFTFGDVLLKRPSEKAIRVARSLAERLRRP